MVGNGSVLSIVSVNNFQIPHTSLAIKNALIVHDIRKKLLSISQFTIDNNCCFVFYPWDFFIHDLEKNWVMFKGLVEGGLYPLRVQPSHTHVALQAINVLATIWYAHLGYPNSRALHSLSPCLPTLNKTMSFCESCTLGKSTKLRFSSCEIYASTFLHMLHMDVWGPISISHDGFILYLVIVDEYSRYVWQCSMAQKSNVILILPRILKILETQFQTQVKIIYTNGRGEFVNYSLKEYFASK